MTAGPSANGNNATSAANEAVGTRDLTEVLASLSKLGKQLKGAGAGNAADRIERAAAMVAADDVHAVTFEELIRVIDPELVIDERADACGRLWRKKDAKDERHFFSRLWGLRRSVRLAQWARNTAALLPLIFTWSALGLAARDYNLDLQANKSDTGKPFLLLWQQGFNGHFLAFGWVAAIDAILLVGVVALTWWVHRVEQSTQEFDTSIWDRVGEIEEAMGYGASRTPVTAEDWAHAIDGIIKKAYRDTADLAEASKVILRDTSKQAASSEAKTQKLIEQLLTGSQALLQGHQELIKGMQADGQGLIEDLQRRNQAVIEGMQVDGRNLIKQLQEGNQEFLAEFQTKTQETISLFSAEVLKTIVSVNEQNVTFIKETRAANERVLNDITQRQIGPLLTRMETLLGQFGTQQESYTASVTGLTESVTAIQQSAARLADNSQEFTGSTQSIADNLRSMASSQGRLADEVRGSADSMTTAANSMTKVKDTLQAVLVDSTQQMTENVTSASESLAQTQASLAQTRDGLAATTEALRDAAASLREAAARPAPPTVPAPRFVSAPVSEPPTVFVSPMGAPSGPDAEPASTPRRRWWQWRRRPKQPGGLGGQ